ncbi:MAG: ABC transporter permease [Butyrivibrio sp.]|uniref:ABC transporter permease n=1 Tax=Butyrivibrio sp. TaxID=28121 RepID=UPI001B7A97B7|nr:ABC transporter permease [Butyrivibrio sp.]MBP3781883.1 ABC transporter permease [Butyrivibrio sp.]MBP3815124.1 ABC transporter permease [Butyrivibrio sp.]
MAKQILKRVLGLVLILLVLSFMVFGIMYLAPGDPAEKRLTSQGVVVTKEILQAERERLGLLRPFIVRYADWLKNVLRGDFGISFKDDLPVAPKLIKGLKNTIWLALSSLFLALIISFPLGLLSAVKKGKLVDHIARLFSFIGNSLPNFLISVLLMYLFCIQIKVFPVIADGSVKGLMLPALSLAIPMAGRFTRQIRSELIDQLGEEYVVGMKLRRVKGRFILINNVLRNSLGHILTIIGLQIGTLMGGSVVIESIFRWPGIGKLVMDSITARDYPVIMGFVLIMGTIYVVINLIVDIIYRLLDPRSF